MEKSTTELINNLGKQIMGLEQPIQLLAICSGGKVIAQGLHKYLKRKKINSNYFEVWTNILNGVSSIWKTNFPNDPYEGTAVIIDDVIWHGTQIPPIMKMLKNCNPHKRVFIATLLDCNKKADFCVFR